jgi:5-amino-6-(5-phosphoribosylamino)uracil reductase
MQLTLVPQLLGGEKSWVPSGCGSLPEDLACHRAWLLQEIRPLGGNELMLRYQRQRGR